MKDMLQDVVSGQNHMIFIGNKGVGKNKLADRLLQLIHQEREYIQLHRDGNGKLLIDPNKVTMEEWHYNNDVIQLHPNFRMWVLANRSGFPFLGNNFFREIGDIFASHAIENPDEYSELSLLTAYAPNVPLYKLRCLCRAFEELRGLVENGTITYPYSTREAVAVAKHLQEFPTDDVGVVPTWNPTFQFWSAMAAQERYYLTSSVLPLPFESAWAHLDRHGTDSHFIHMMGIYPGPSSYYWRRSCLTTKSAAARVARDDQRDLTVIARRWRSPLSSTRATATPSTCARPLAACPRRSCACFAVLRRHSRSPSRPLRTPRSAGPQRGSNCAGRRGSPSASRLYSGSSASSTAKTSSLRSRAAPTRNGWLHSVLVTGTIAFGGDGCIIWMKHNCPGSWNDGDTSREFREKLLDPTATLQHLGVLADAAFPVTGCMLGRIVTPLKNGDLLRAVAQGANEAEVERVNSALISIRQTAEWGMSALDRVFRRLLGLLPFDPVVRRRRLANIHHLYNLRVRTTSISQIRTVF
ncbi:hypothetical protein PsorP6_004735 [Peronosclerospora sorghi]|uniref:Uncharacterized protein n=1 Tax=Peronosclerospora sorghi TaxID=230839 RepID=A0ACC0VNV3_9STRA|nr:hypothetical protein PsorP6_004735 [Peronosclerospora sorghi]